MAIKEYTPAHGLHRGDGQRRIGGGAGEPRPLRRPDNAVRRSRDAGFGQLDCFGCRFDRPLDRCGGRCGSTRPARTGRVRRRLVLGTRARSPLDGVRSPRWAFKYLCAVDGRCCVRRAARARDRCAFPPTAMAASRKWHRIRARTDQCVSRTSGPRPLAAASSTFLGAREWHLDTHLSSTGAAGPSTGSAARPHFERFYGSMPANASGRPRDSVRCGLDAGGSRKKPFFMYFCSGAMHAPHQAPREWTDKYRGAFDDGWDAYRVKVFEQQLRQGLSARHQAVGARSRRARLGRARARREAAVRAHDGGVRRVPRAHRPSHRASHRLPGMGIENTLVMVVSDNGASAEGGPTGR